MLTINTPTPIDVFMRLAATHYYAHRESIGSRGDFVTAPEISQMFGEVVGAWCAAECLARGEQSFHLVELGAGNGTMMSDILRATKDIASFTKNLKNVIIVENSPRLRAKQASKLDKYGDKISWANSIQELPEGNLIIVANEFLDALPIKQFEKIGDNFVEIGVGFIDSKLRYIQMDKASIDSPSCPEKGIVEVCEDAINIANCLATRKGGYVSALFIDYGYFTPPFTTTLQAVKAHKYHDVLSNIGEADITAHVDFGSLDSLFKANGFTTAYATQGEFLLRNGIEIRAKKLIASGADYFRIQKDLSRLISQNEMGLIFKAFEARSINS